MIYIVLPTYNEADNIRDMVETLLGLGLDDLHLLIVDDNSPDGTGKIADELVAAHPSQVEVVHRAGKEGLGKAYLAGFAHALARGAGVIVQMDADFSHSPTYVPTMIAKLADYDVVVGSRYVRGGSVDEKWQYGRWLLSWFANSIYTRIILNCRTRDLTAGFKAWRRDTLLGLDLDRVKSNGYVFQVEMAYLAEHLGYRVLEVPIFFEERRLGTSKMDMPVKIEAALRTWEVRWRHRGLRPSDRRPLNTETAAG